MSRRMRQLQKRDLTVLVLCAALLAAAVGAIGETGRERAKRAVCLANLRQLTAAWIDYAEHNDGKIVNGDAGEYPTLHSKEPPWVLRDWASSATLLQKQAAITEGALFPYTQNVRLYRCPLAGPAQTRSYTIVDAMNGKDWPGGALIKNRSEIVQPEARFVFVNVGDPLLSMGGWTCFVREDRWWDPPPIQHGDGANFSFADGHAEHWMWKDARTVEFGRRMVALSELQAGNEDIRRTQEAAWGVEHGGDTAVRTGRRPAH